MPFRLVPKLALIPAFVWYVIFMAIWIVGVYTDSRDQVLSPTRAIVGGALVYGPLSSLLVYLGAVVFFIEWFALASVVRSLRRRYG